MTLEPSNFAAQLRRFIDTSSPSPENPRCGEEDRSDRGTSQTLRVSGSDEVFSRLALELFAIQYCHNAAYRRLCEARGIASPVVEHWSRIPAAPAAAFKELELTTLPRSERTTVFQSSGTTGQRPSQHFHNAESLAVYEASLWQWFSRHVVSGLHCSISNGRLAILTPPPSQAPQSSLVHMCDTVRRALGAPESAFLGHVAIDGSWVLKCDPALALLLRSRRREDADGRVVAGHEPLIVLGTAFSFVHLLDHMEKRDITICLPPGSRVMETGGYKGRSRNLPRAELHRRITQRLGVPSSSIVGEYGMSELSSQAYDTQVRSEESGVRSGNRVFLFPPWVRTQIVSPETGCEAADGETGLIRVFDLANVFSVLAIQTEDLGVRRGDGFELIGRAQFAEPRGCSLMAV